MGLGGGVEKWSLKLTSAKVVVEVEAELGNISKENTKNKTFYKLYCTSVHCMFTGLSWAMLNIN